VGVGDKALGGFSTALLVARPLVDARGLGDRVVVATDGLQTSQAVIELAARLARAHASKVTLVHALGRESLIKRGRRPVTREHERMLGEHERMLTGIPASGASELLVEPGRAPDVIKSAAAAADASLVVMGSRRLDGLRAMGSVSRRVVHQARCSVLLVPPEELTT
jgi:nucleotide-binding universal stress UspA family protein